MFINIHIRCSYGHNDVVRENRRCQETSPVLFEDFSRYCRCLSFPDLCLGLDYNMNYETKGVAVLDLLVKS